MSSGGGGAGYSPPDWLSQLKPLAAVAGTLVTVASNPAQWARNNLVDVVREIVAVWIVGGFLDATQYVLGWFVFAYERTREILLDAIPILETPTDVAESAITGVIGAIYGLIKGIARSAGLAGPPAAAFTVGVMVLITGAVLYGGYRVIPGSDFVEGTLDGVRR